MTAGYAAIFVYAEPDGAGRDFHAGTAAVLITWTLVLGLKSLRGDFHMKEIRYFDCFSGIGGFCCAAGQIESDKYKLLHTAYCEADAAARRFYGAVYHTEKVQAVHDVKDICTYKNPGGIRVNDFNLLFAGFPCQSFSNIGHRRGFDDSRGQLFFYILDILDYYKPAYFVLENVQKIQTINKGKLLKEIKCSLVCAGDGYVLYTWNLNAADYGLPQKRNRIFFCGVRKDLSESYDIGEPPKVDLKVCRYPATWHLLEKGNVDARHYISQGSRKTILTKPDNWQGSITIDNSVAKPLTATMSKWHRANQDNYFSESYITGNEPYIHPTVDMEKEPIRRITPLEGYRLQGFPDIYDETAKTLKLSYSAQYRMIGNALPVNLAYAVVKHFLDSCMNV